MWDADFLTLYPELAGHRRLADVVRDQLHAQDCGVRVDDPLGAAYARAEGDRRACQVTLALKTRAFSVDFWDRGVEYGRLSTPDLSVVAVAIQRFVATRAAIAELEQRVPKIEILDAARAHELGKLVDFRWQQRLRARPSTWPDDLLHDVFALAANGRFRALLPFTSLSRACFSTRTGYPYTRDCPAIEVLRDGTCRVFPPDQLDVGPPVFEGVLVDAVHRAERLLPSTLVAARDGTAEDDAA